MLRFCWQTFSDNRDMQHHIALVWRSFTRARARMKSKSCRRRGGERKFLMAVKCWNCACDNSMIILYLQNSWKASVMEVAWLLWGKAKGQWPMVMSDVLRCLEALVSQRWRLGHAWDLWVLISRTLQRQRLQAVARRSWPFLLQGAQIGKICLDL